MSLVRYQLCVTPQQYNTCIHNTQALANLAPSWYFSAEAAYRRGDVEDLHIQATTFIEVLEDLERVLATRREFLLGPWLEAAKVTNLKAPSKIIQALATTDAESRLYEFNARNQITLWGPDGDLFAYHFLSSQVRF